MRVLITGAKGMLATALIQALKDNHEVIGKGKGELDITDREVTGKAIASIRPDVVINAAAFTRVDECEEKKELAFNINADGPKTLALACRDYGVRLTQISTDYIFDGTKTSPYVEDDPPNPINVYGMSKLKGEENIREVLKDYNIVRTQWLYGEKGQNFVETILRLAREQDELRIVDDQWGCPTYTKDLAYAIKALLEEGCTGIYHAADSGTCTWYGFALEILKLAGIKKKVIPITTEEARRPARRLSNSILSCERLKRDVGLVLRPWPEALREYMQRRDSFLSDDKSQ